MVVDYRAHQKLQHLETKNPQEGELNVIRWEPKHHSIHRIQNMGGRC